MLLALQYLGKNKEGHGGVVINIGSAQSFRPQISTPIYCASKHAILALSKSCGVNAFSMYLFVFFRVENYVMNFFLLFGQDAYHFNVTGVRVIVVCPGLLQHDASSSNFGNRFKSPSHEKAWQLIDMKGVHPQKYVHFLRWH